MAIDRIAIPDKAFGLDARSRLARMRTIAHLVLAEWQAEVRATLRSSRAAYIKSLAIREVTETTATVDLAGAGVGRAVAQLARMVEFGMGPGGIGTQGAYDIRTFVLRAGTRKLRFGKSGPYVNVPFTRSPKEIKEMGGAGALRAARGLQATVANAAGGTKWGGRLATGLASNLPNGRIKPHHVADALQGLVRLASTYSKNPEGTARVQTTGYRLFRRMAWSGQPWMHPGIRAHRLAEKVVAKVPDLVRMVL